MPFVVVLFSASLPGSRISLGPAAADAVRNLGGSECNKKLRMYLFLVTFRCRIEGIGPRLTEKEIIFLCRSVDLAPGQQRSAFLRPTRIATSGCRRLSEWLSDVRVLSRFLDFFQRCCSASGHSILRPGSSFPAPCSPWRASQATCLRVARAASIRTSHSGRNRLTGGPRNSDGLDN